MIAFVDHREQDSQPTSGQRGRFHAPLPPAIVPSSSKTEPSGTTPPGSSQAASQDSGSALSHSQGTEQKAAQATADAPAGSQRESSATGATDATADAASTQGKASAGADTDTKKHTAADSDDSAMLRTGGSMAIATLLSRITGFLRAVFISAALGGAVSSAFNTANTLPNLVTELVLGAVLTALVVPVLVRAEKEDADKGEAFIRRLLTITFSITIVVTIASVLLAPVLIRISLPEDGKVNIEMATAFSYLLLPQILFYAMFAVFMAVLNTKGIFKPGAWAPVANNIVTLAVMSLYFFVPEQSRLQPTDNVTFTNPHVMLLGLGTTLGVVIQAVIMLPYLKKANINLKPLWGLDDRLKAFGGMAVAIILYVAISQVGWNLNNRIAGNTWAVAPTIYMQAWQLLQMPYGVIGVTLLTAVMPRLSRNAADGDDKAVVRDLTVASKLTMMALVPVIVFYTCFGTLIATALFAYKNFSMDDATVLGWTVSFSAFTLIPYAIVLLHLRVFYAREEVWTPTFIIAGITITKLALAYTAPHIATEPRLVVVLLGAANGFGFLAGAIIGDRLLRRSLGSLQFRKVTKTVLWALGSSLLGALVAWRVDVLIHTYVFPDVANPYMLFRLLISGVIFLGVTGVVLLRAPLPEISLLLGVLSRVPGLAKVLPKPRPADVEEEKPYAPQQATSAQELAARESASMSGSMMGTALPPLSAGRVRGPRLVAGAPILEGRYRLLADHGGSSSARLWQGRDVSDGSIVALTIMDPCAYVKAHAEPGEYINPNGARVRKAKDDILRRSAKLKDLDEPGMAKVRRVIDYGTLVLIVSDWMQGSPLTTVAESAPDPLAAGYAVASLADAAAAAHDAETCLGLDHRDRLRVTTQGTAVVAFPGVLPNNSTRQDTHGIAVALGLLLEHVPFEDVPDALTNAYRTIKDLNSSDTDAVDLRKVAKQLRSIATGELSVAEDDTPDPSSRAGFGAERNRPRNLVMAGGLAFVTVVLLAALIAGLVSILGGNRNDSPLSTNSLRQGAESIVDGDPAPVTLSNARAWMPVNGKGTEDNPSMVPLVLDGNPATRWESDVYVNQLGPGPNSLKEGVGILIDLPQDTRIHSVALQGLTPGTTMQLRTSTGDPTTLNDTTLLDTVSVTAPDMTVELDPTRRDTPSTTQQVPSANPASPSDAVTVTVEPQPGASASADPGSNPNNDPKGPGRPKGNRLLLWITGLPMPNAASISDISVQGTWPGMNAEDQPKGSELSTASSP